MTEPIIVVYGTNYCGDCYRARRILIHREVEFRWIDVGRDKDAEQYVKQVNRGMRSVPTIVFPDGSLLVEPSNAELEAKLDSLAVPS
jgi:mycoredoxin